jgi:PAS domain S-box-containing protein
MSATTKSLRCLIVEDVDDDAQLMLRQLRTDGHDVTWERVDTPEAMRAALARQPWDVVLSDYRMPRFSGLAALEILRASGIDLPFIIVSGTIGEAVAVAAMQAGVDDYLIKGELAHLTVAVERELRNAVTRRERAAVAAALRENQALLAQAEALGKVGGWEFDVETKQQTWTDAVYAIHELDRAVHPTVSQGVNFYTPESQLIIARAVQRAIELGEPFDVELEIITAKGNRRSVHAVGQAAPTRRKVSGFIQDITERKQAEATLRESEHQYRELFEAAGDALLLLTSDTGRVIDANPMATVLYGYERAELLTKQNTDLSAEPEKTTHRTHEAQSHPGQVYNIPLRLHRKKDGTVFPVEITARSFIQQGQSVLLVACRDITERKKAEAARREDEERHRTILQTSQDGFWVVDVQGHLKEVNAAYARMSGYRVEELLGMGIPDLEAAETAAVAAEHMQRIVRQGSDRFESKHRRKDGSVFDVEVNVQVQSGEGAGFVCFLRDITERRRAEQMVREKELKYRTLFETAEEAILLFTDGCWIDCNSGALKVFGCTREQIIGAHPSRFSPPTQPDGRPSEAEAIKLINLAFTGIPQSFEWEHCRADGTPFAAEVSLNRLDLGGKPHMQAIVRDISGRHRAEAARRQSEADLRRAQEIAHLGNWSMDLQENFLTWSAEMYRIFGATPETFDHTPEGIAKFIHPEDAALHSKSIETVQQGWTFEPLEYRAVRPDGEIRVVHVFACEMERDTAGRPVRVVGAVQDITERKKAEEQIRQSAEELRARNEMLSRFNAVAVGRELRMIELKQEVNALCAKVGEPPRFRVPQSAPAPPPVKETQR